MLVSLLLVSTVLLVVPVTISLFLVSLSRRLPRHPRTPVPTLTTLTRLASVANKCITINKVACLFILCL